MSETTKTSGDETVCQTCRERDVEFLALRIRALRAEAALRDIAAIAEEYNYIGWQRIVSIMQNRSIQALAETEETKP
jgi:hypothetical protein